MKELEQLMLIAAKEYFSNTGWMDLSTFEFQAHTQLRLSKRATSIYQLYLGMVPIPHHMYVHKIQIIPSFPQQLGYHQDTTVLCRRQSRWRRRRKGGAWQ